MKYRLLNTFVSLVVQLGTALRLSSVSEKKETSFNLVQPNPFFFNATFNVAFQMLNSTLTGKCHYVNSENEVISFGDHNLPEAPGMLKLPAYSCIPASGYRDLEQVLLFARTFYLKVNIKNDGHSFHGASGAALPDDGGTTMMIWMKNFNSINIRQEGFYDSCGTFTGGAVQLGGGIRHFELYEQLGKVGNYTFLGGTCSSVSPGGGWPLGTGLSMYQMRAYGLAIDNVLQYELMLSTGHVLNVDRCSHPSLFKSLRGGGGGFGITLSVWLPLWSGTQVQFFRWAFPNRTVVNHTKWWEVVVRGTVEKNRWQIDPGGFTASNYGYPMTEAGMVTMMATFLGPAEEAEKSFIYRDFSRLLNLVPQRDRHFHVLQFGTLADFKLHEGSWDTTGMAHEPKGEIIKMMEKVNLPLYTGTWGIPMKFFVEHADEAARLLEDLNEDNNCFGTIWYQWGGVLLEAKLKSHEVVAHPRIYEWAYSPSTCDAKKYQAMVHKFPLSEGGGFELNHMLPEEAKTAGVDIVEDLWGKENYEFMLGVKQMYDPSNVLGCRNCVAWPPHLPSFKTFLFNPFYLRSLPK